MNSCLVSPSVNTIGKNTHIVVNVDANMAPETCCAPYTAALYLFIPLFLNLYIFSITTILLSTSIPTPRARPDNEIIFNVTLLKYIRTIANSKLIGILKAITIVGLILFKKINKTNIAKIPPYIRLFNTLEIIKFI